MLRDLVWIKTFAEEAAAARAADVLRAHGIEPVVSADLGDTRYRVPPPVPGIRLGVRADDVRAALTLLWTWPKA